MRSSEIREAADRLRAIVKDIERGDLNATALEDNAIRGAVIALDAVADAPRVRPRVSSVSRRFERDTPTREVDTGTENVSIDLRDET